MAEKEFITWKEKWKTGIKKIDEQHNHFVEIINKTAELIRKKQDGPRLSAILVDLTEFARVHFSTEEKYFDETNYPETEEHKKKHSELLEKVLLFDKQFEKRKEDFKFMKEFLDFLKFWLEDHLVQVDHRYVKWLTEHGIK